MATVRPELTPAHHAQLCAFARLVNEMCQCRFIQRYNEQDHGISCERDANGEPVTTAPDYDWEDFRSFMTTFRKVGIAKDEPTYLSKIYGMVGLYASDTFREILATDRKQVMLILDGTWTGMHVETVIDGKEAKFSSAQLLDMVTNGMIFHEAPRHQAAVEKFSKEPRWSYLWLAIHYKIIPILQVAIRLLGNIQHDQILGDAEYPEEWRHPSAQGMRRRTREAVHLAVA